MSEAGKVRFDNPIAAEDLDDDKSPGTPGRMADFEHELTDDELGDLTYAFQAMDADANGTLEPDELHAMMSVLGAGVDMATVETMFRETKAEFQAWISTHDEETVLPDWMDEDHVGNQGVHGETKSGATRTSAALEIKRGDKQHPVFSRLKKIGKHPLVAYTVGAPLTATQKLLTISGALAKDTVTQGLDTVNQINPLSGGTAEENEAAQKALHELIVSDKHMIFAEYCHMMCSHQLMEKYCPGDWHKRCGQMRKYRSAFNMADVDGDNSLEFDELEMVVIAMDPHHGLTHEDMVYLWKVMFSHELSPVVSEEVTGGSLTFLDYLLGVSMVDKDERCKGWMDTAKPNKMEMISLLIDTPVSKEEEQMLLEALTPIERMGIKILQQDYKPMDKENMRGVLDRAGDGHLRTLEESQVKKMKGVKSSATFWGGVIGFMCTIVPCFTENVLGDYLAFDGAKDAYFVCNRIGEMVNNSGTWEINATYVGDEWTNPLDPDLMACKIYRDVYGENTGLGGWDRDTLEPFDGPESRCVDDLGPEGWDSPNYANDRGLLGKKKDMCSKCECLACGCLHHDDGELVMDEDHPSIEFWVILGIAIGINVVLEIGLLMWLSVRWCVKVSWALDQRLVPLNKDRAFVADSLVRAAFELGNPDSPVLGVDPQSEPNGHLKVVLMVGLYKLKAVGTAFVFKTIFGLFVHDRYGMWIKPWIGTCLAAVLWDALITSCIVLQAQVRGFGVYTSAEAFNEVMDLHYPDYHDISMDGKIQIARGVGVAIVKNGSMYPTMELLLRHSIQFLHLKGKKCVAEPGVLDNQDLLLEHMKPQKDGGPLNDEERLVAMSIHLLACMIDGDMGHSQMELWEQLCEAAGDLAEFYPDRIRSLGTRFRDFDCITAKDLHEAFDPRVELELPAGHKQKYWCFQLQNFLTC